MLSLVVSGALGAGFALLAVWLWSKRAAVRTAVATGEAKPEREATASSAEPKQIVVALVIAGVGVTFAFGLYALLGNPGMPGQPSASRNADSAFVAGLKKPPTSNQTMSLEDATANLERKLQSNPDDIDGWVLLARSYAALGNMEQAIAVFEDAIERAPDDINVRIQFGEALVSAAEGNVTEKAKHVFEEARAVNPAHPGIDFHLGLYDYQQDEFQAAYDRWLALGKTAPVGAAWLPVVQDKLTLAARELGFEPDQLIDQQIVPSLGPPANSAPTLSDETVSAAMEMDPEDRTVFIRSMVDGLAAKLEDNPNNLDGWLRLARSYGVLGEWNNSIEAYQAALELSPNDASIQSMLDQAKQSAMR